MIEAAPVDVVFLVTITAAMTGELTQAELLVRSLEVLWSRNPVYEMILLQVSLSDGEKTTSTLGSHWCISRQFKHTY